MLLRSTPCDGGAVTLGEYGGGGLATVPAHPSGPAAVPDLPCQVGDADLWFAESPADLEQAKALCQGCPIRAECLNGALRRQEPWGVWGGEIFEKGSIVPRKRPRGRPRKADLARDRAWAAARERTVGACA